MVHSRHHSSSSSSYVLVNKSQPIPTPSNASIMCGYSASSDYPGGNGGSWTMNSSSSYGSSTGSMQSSDQRRWLSQQQDVSFRPRDRPSECRATYPPHHPMDTHNSLQGDLVPSQFIEQAGALRSHFQPSYSRPSSTVSSQWPGSWELDAGSASPPLHSQTARYSSSSSSSWSSQLNVQIPSFDPNQQFDAMLFTSSDSSSASTSSLYTPHSDAGLPLNGFALHRLSPIPSPSPSPVYYETKPVISPQGSRRGSNDRTEPNGKSCSHCRATSTPLWRRDPSTMKPLCNACGLYLQQRNKLRPQELIEADDDGSTEEESDPNYVGPECSHCHTHRTSVWRRSKTGDQLCNACGVYARLRGKPRPLSLKRSKIRPRSKHSPK
ncbi:hypothetical protein CVT24_007235 [Panaeolus cyanescens]|uniref:GATA-type domain-containing protein n=1 Tax=Panaeolus cyanescens TaxID=181874 RepID=A0A409YPB6_9AGAR|nr:hypothetical protein CVT24_007235 [Panaeolus cyanescens]